MRADPREIDLHHQHVDWLRSLPSPHNTNRNRQATTMDEIRRRARRRREVQYLNNLVRDWEVM